MSPSEATLTPDMKAAVVGASRSFGMARALRDTNTNEGRKIPTVAAFAYLATT